MDYIGWSAYVNLISYYPTPRITDRAHRFHLCSEVISKNAYLLLDLA